MKLLNYLFSFYLLLLTCMPCADIDNDCLDNTSTITNQTANHKDNEKHNETCSPFCICACCGHQAAVTVFLDSMKYIRSFEPEKRIPTYHQGFIGSYYGHIWQPPKLS